MSTLVSWLETSLRRVYPRTPAGAARKITLPAACNDKLSFQICVRNTSPEHEAKAEVLVEAPDELLVQTRRVGYVAQLHMNTGVPQDELEGFEHLPGYVPDPLYSETSVVLGPMESHAFWVSVVVPAGIRPGPRTIRITVKAGDKETRSLSVVIDVHPLTIDIPRDFLVGHWFFPDALCDWYKVEPYERRFWPLVEPYMANYLGHGNNVMFVPHLTPPINGEHRPHQLLKVSIVKPGEYRFDFSDLRLWIGIAKSFGAHCFLFSHLFTQWGARHAPCVYRSNQDPLSLLWPKWTEATAPVYRTFLAQYLPALHTFLKRERILDRTYVSMSDEPHGDEMLANYGKAKAMVREIAPWMRAMDGLSDVRFHKEGLCELPISGITEAAKFAAEKIPHCVYYCCGPRGRWLNRLFDTPLVKIRMTGWLAHRLGAAGFMHWGYNYWYRGCSPNLLDPFLEQAYGEWPFIPYGDPFEVYPGKDGPLDSIRWEVFAESMHDVALLRTAGVSPDSRLLAPIQSYEVFPKTDAWIRATRRRVLQNRGR